MSLKFLLASVALAMSSCASTSSNMDVAAKTAEGADWHMNATIIEACSCPMFCQCYFNAEPAGPGCCSKPDDPTSLKRFCRFNNAFRVNDGTFHGTSLDGAKFWLAGDLGGDFSKGEMDWCVLTFDPSVTPAQREGITQILGHVYPVKWNSFKTAKDAPMEWTASRDHATAKLDKGKAAEVVLKKNQGMSDEPIVIKNLKYWGAPRNDGFICMANEVEAFRATDHPFEYKGTNGFMITLDISSKDVTSNKAY